MVLSQVEIAGFKSFARKTRIPFKPGMTAVVGPNGCGKSNVVDAIRWVLGEQKTGVLRSDRMENVIFAGTQQRKPLGLAEVTLGLNNNSGLLPIPQSEIHVTRRLFRSGESEYLLNHQTCRLKDIVELFQDTGIGPDSYSIIELKMVEDILSDDPSSRRHLFEEAAGVSKYKHRRKQTTKKLENVQEDLERLGDILREVESQAGSLKRQMRRAKRYMKMKEDWRRGQASVARRSLITLTAGLETYQKQLAELSGETVRQDGSISGSEAVLEASKVELATTERELKELGNRLSKLESGLIRTEENIKHMKQRRTDLEESRERWSREKLLLDEKQKRIRENLESLEGRIDQATDHRQQCSEVLKEAQDILAEVKHQRTTTRDNLDRLTVTWEQQHQTYLQSVGELSRIEAKLEQIDGQSEEIDNRIKHSITQLAESEDQILQVKKELESRERELNRLNTQFEETVSKRDKLRESLEQSRLELSNISHRIDTLKSRLSWLQSAVGEGSSQQEAVQWLFDQKLPGIIGTLGDVIEAPDWWRPLIAAVLGDESHWVVCESRKTALDAIGKLRKAKKGQLTFLTLDSVEKQSNRKSIADTLKKHGVEGSLMNAVTNDGTIRSLLELRLGSVVGVKGEPSTELLSSAASEGITVVTDQGDVYWHTGMLRGGQISDQSSVTIGRMKNIKDLESQLVEEQKHIKRYSSDISKVENELKVVSETLDNQQSEVVISRTQVEESRIKLNRLAAVSEQHHQYNTKLEQDLKAMVDQKGKLQERLMLVTTKRDACKNDIKQLEKKTKTVSREVTTMEDRVETLTAKENKATMAFLDASNKLENLEKEQSQIQEQLQELDQSMVTREEEVSRAGQEIEDIENRRLEAERGLVERFKERDGLWSKRDRLQQHLEEAKGRISHEESRLRDARKHHETTTGERHRNELEITRIQGDIQQITERLKDYDIPLEILDNIEDEEGEIFDEETLNALKHKIELMEPVNLLAIEEFESVNKRYEFLRNQRDDLVESREMLEDTIGKINEVATQKFFETFQKIRRNFQEIFRELFGDGDADLLLSGQDLLESEISIWANPSGKKLKTLGLMSGGEKALTAITLLLSIYRYKPSPFCILDEVDAPLDDANIDRFLNILRTFSEHTQFIVVTHNKRTMEEADQLHGITMEEEGVSKLVSVELESYK